MSQNKVTYGLQDVHIAFFDEATSTPAVPAWETPIAIPGAVRFTPATVGDTSTFYADNTAYFTATANNGYTAELEMANFPDAIIARMLGWEIDDNGALSEIADAIPKHFALLGQIQGDKRNRRFVYYDCVAGRPAKERSTKNESITPATDVLSLTISPILVNGKMRPRTELELNENNVDVYNNFFDSVYLPTVTVPTP